MILRALVGLALLFCLPAMAQPLRDQLRQPVYRTFFADLQQAVRTNDRQRILGMISYPLRVTTANASGTGRRSRFYRAPSAVRARFDRIFTPRVRAVILRQRYEEIFVNSRGFMIGNGEVWFERTCLDRQCNRMTGPRIMTVNP